MNTQIKNIISSSIQVKNDILGNEDLITTISNCADAIHRAFKSGNKVLFCGNGGSAADAQHLAAEFSGRFYKDRIALPAEALHVNTSYLTAVANDYGYEHVYSRIVNGIGNTGDVLVGLSTSGNSKNVVNAFEISKNKGMTVVGLTGSNGGKMEPFCDYWIGVPSSDTPRIQESHILVGHILCQLVEELYFNP